MAQQQLERLEKQLMEAGNRLLSPPSSAPELLSLLDRVENLLTSVEQSPTESMKKALSPSMKALIADELLRHSDVDVKVAVASCISEITRITAPDAPYEDDQMKEVFQLIVSAFEKLDDKSSPSYIKRTSILETVAKVRSCVVMLDLECDALIVEMFQHFLKSIRDDHPENVFSSMETIMTLVLEESEEISLDLLSSILDFLKTENKDVQPAARQLGEKVIEKCASKLKPYLLPAVKYRGASLEAYSKVVANVCQLGPEAVEPSDGDAASKNLADESGLANAPSEKAVEVAMDTLDDAPPSEEVGPANVGSPKSVMSNGTLQKEVEDTSGGNDNSKEADHATQDEVKTDPESAQVDGVDGEELAKSQSKPEKSNKRKGRKASSSKSSVEPSEPSVTESKVEPAKMPEHEEKEGKDVDSTPSKEPVVDSVEHAETKKEADAVHSSPKTSNNEPVDVPSPSPSGSLADDSHTKKGGRGKKKDDKVQESGTASDVDCKKESDTKKVSEGTSSESKVQKRTGKKASCVPDKDESVPSPVDASKTEDEITVELDPKSKKQRTGKKVSSVPDKDEGVPTTANASKKEDEDTTELDAKSTKQSGKKVEPVSSQREDKKKRGQGKATPGKEPAKTPSKNEDKKPVSLPKSAAKSAKDESDVEKTPKMNSDVEKAPKTNSDVEKTPKTNSDVEKTPKKNSKRKRSLGEEKASKHSKKTYVYGEEMVGQKIQVWWPMDKSFYEGVVESYDPVKKMHKIAYDDGDEEVLKLARQKWRQVNGDTVQSQEQTSDGERPADESSESPKGKNSKPSADIRTKQGKTETSVKKGGASSSKSKATPKSDAKANKGDTKASGKNKEEASKSVKKSNEDKGVKSKDSKAANKSTNETPSKSTKKSKDDNVETSKSGTKSKQETPKTAAKSKSKSSKTGGKSNTNNGTGNVKGSSSSSKEEEVEDAEKSPEPTKAPENSKAKSQSSSKSQKKRKRGTKS